MEKQKKNLSKKQIALVFALLLVLIIVISILFGGSSDNKKSNQGPVLVRLSVGDIGILNDNKEISDCSGTVVVASTEKDYEEYLDKQIADDTYGYSQMIGTGEIALIPNCTAIKVIDSNSGLKQFRLIEDQSITAWVPLEFAVNVENPGTEPQNSPEVVLGSYRIDSEELVGVENQKINVWKSYDDRTLVVSLERGVEIDLLERDENNNYCLIKQGKYRGWLSCDWLIGL